MDPLYEKEAQQLKRLFKENSKITQREFAKRYNLGTPGNLWQYLNGRRPLNASIASTIARGLGIGVEEFSPRLAQEINSMKSSSNVVPFEMPKLKKVPRISFAQAGLFNETGQTKPVEWFIDNGEFDWIDDAFPDGCVTMTVEGRSMEPDFQEGDIIVVNPHKFPNPGDFVVAKRQCQFTDGVEYSLKKYRPTGYDENGNTVFDLVPLNPDFPTLKSDRDRCSVLGVVVEHRRRF